MSNALVEHYRRALPRDTAGLSDDDLTAAIADTFRTAGSLNQLLEQYPDFRRDVLARNDEGNVLAETVAAGKAGVLDRLPGTLENFGALVADTAAQQNLAEALGLEAPLARAGSALRGVAQVNREEAAERIADAGGRTIGRVEDIRLTRPRDYLLWALPTFAENAPSMLASLGAGAAAGMASGGSATPALAAAGLTSIAQNAGDVYGELTEQGADPGKAIDAAWATGVPMGLLDVASELLPLAKVSALFKGAPAGAMMERMASVAGRGGLAGAGRGAVTQALAEGGTETLQELVQIAGEEYATGKMVADDQLRSRLMNSAAGGAIVGGPLGGLFGALPNRTNEATVSQQPPVESAAPRAPAEFGEALKQLGVTPEQYEALSADESDLVPMPEGAGAKVEVAPSQIAGQGILATDPIEAGEVVAPAFVEGNRTPAGRFVNHAADANAELQVDPAAPLSLNLVATRPLTPGEEVTVDYRQAQDAMAEVVKAEPSPGPVEPLAIADLAPARLARTTSANLEADAGRGGRFAIAIEKDGKVEVRNVYERAGERFVENAAELVPEAKLKGTGRRLSMLTEAGWKVRHEPFQLAAQRPNLKLTMAPEEFDLQVSQNRQLQDHIVEAINDGRGDRVVEAGLRVADPAGWRAVEFLRDRIAADTGAAPSHVLMALGTRVDSVATRDSLRASATAKKLAAGDVLRRKDGKIFGVFSEPQWQAFKATVAEGKGDAALDAQFETRAHVEAWGGAMAKLGAAEQAGEGAFRAKAAAGTLADPVVSMEAPGVADRVASRVASDETGAISLSPEGQLSEAQLREALQRSGLEQGALDAALAEMRDYESLTRDDIHDILEYGPEFQSFRDRAADEGDGFRTGVVDQLLRLKETTDLPPGPVGTGVRAPEGGVLRAPGRSAEDLRASQPLADANWRVPDAAVTQAWGAATAALREAGLDVAALQAAVGNVDEFYRQTGGRTDGRRFIELVLKDLAAPTATDLEVAVHEAVHVLFAAQPETVRGALHRAVARLPDPDPAINASLNDPRPEVRAEEKLAVLLQGEGLDAGQATDFAGRLLRLLKDLYLQVAEAVSRALGLNVAADRFALRYFRNRLAGLLQGDYAPRSLVNALGGRALSFGERAALLPGFGRTLGRMARGEFEWSPKVPDSPEAIDHNLDVAFSRPAASESEANLRRGVEAVNAILADRSKAIRGAMFRPEVGSITFEWGNPGNAAKQFRGGFGIGHILARRALVGGMKPEEAIASLIETIAYGDASAPYGGEGDTRVQIAEGNNLVVLSLARNGQRETWVITSMERHAQSASAMDTGAKSGPSTPATQPAPAFSQDELVAIADALKLGTRLRVVNAAGMRYSRPRLSTAETPIGAVDNPANAINRDLATLNHAITVETSALTALRANAKVGPVLGAVATAGKNPADWLRSQFRFEDPVALKARAMLRLDPKTGAPIAGVNSAQDLSGFADVSNAAPARIHAYQMAWNRIKAMSRRLSEDRHDLARLQNQHKRVQDEFIEAHRNYLNAEGLTSLVLKGVRQLIARERRMGARAGQQLGVLMQQLRELDGRKGELIDREYAGVFKNLFAGNELRGRQLFDLLDQLVNEARVDFRNTKIADIRKQLAERHAAGLASPEVALLLDATPSSRALLATVVAYAKTNADVLAQIERRRLKNVAERMDLQQKLDKLIAERSITNQAVTDLPKTAKLEERARILYVQAKQRARAIADLAKGLEQRIAAAETALPIYHAAVEGLQRELGGVRPDYTFADGMTYRVPEKNAAGQTELRPHQMKLAGTPTPRKTLDSHLAAMTEWLGVKERAGELDADYRDVLAARNALLEGGYWTEDLRKTDTWVRGNVFMPVGARAEATGLPSGRIVGQMFNRFSAVENELRATGQRLGDKTNRLRDAAVAVLNRATGKKAGEMTVDRYYAEVAEPAMSILEKSTDLLELGLTREQAMARAYQRVVNQLLANPSTEPFVRGKETAVAAALRAHLDAVAEASQFFNDTNARYGLGVRDERIITTRGDGIEAAGIRDSLPVGLQTYSRRASALAGRVYRIMRGAGWAAFADAIVNAADTYRTNGPDALRAQLQPFFADRTIAEDFLGALATTDTYSAFDAPVLPDGVTRAEADPARVAQAWRTAQGDVVAFIEALYDAHNGTSDRGQYVQETLQRMQEYFEHLAEMLEPNESGMVPDGMKGLTSNLMIDARMLDRWPTAWSEHLFFDPHTNHQLARRVAAQVAFGRDTERLAEVWAALEKEMDGVKAEYDAVVAREQRQGFTGRKLDARVEADYVARLGARGKAEFARVKRLAQLRPHIAAARTQVRAYFSSKDNQLDAVRFATQLGSTVAFGMLNNPGTALMNLADLFAPVAQGGVSGATLRQVLNNWRFLGEGVAGSLAQAVGLDLRKSSRLQNLWVGEGYNDPAVALQYLGRTEDGLRSDLTSDRAARGREEGPLVRAMRLMTRTVGFGITPRDGSRFTALRPLAPFQQFVLETMRASTLSAWSRVEDMVLSGLEHFAANPAAATDPNFKLTAAALGMKGAEAATFEAFRRRLAEGYGLELTALVREALERQAGPRDRNALLSRASRALIQGMVANELILEGNLATMTPKAWTSGFARFCLPLWGWPIRRALQVARMGMDPDERYRVAAIGRALAALGVMAGAGLAMSLLVDEYHEEIVGRKRNLRSVKALPGLLGRGDAGEAFLTLMENVNRAGTFGMWGELLNTGINGVGGGGDNRTLSFDQRVVMMNSMLSLGRAFSTMAAQHEVDYAGVVRPAIMALGGNGALQYLQIGNHALRLDNIEARFVERVDTQNRLRVAGRQLGLEVRTGAGGSAAPTPLTPIITRMVLAAYAGDRAEFLQQWRDGVAEARAQGKEDPVAYVRDSFSGRHPLKTVFRMVSQDDYARLLRSLDEDGRREVKSAVNRFNAYAESLDARAYIGSTGRRRQDSTQALRLRALGL